MSEVLKARPQRLLDRVKAVLEAQPVTTPTTDELARELHVPVMAIREILRVGVNAGQLICLDSNIYYTPEQLERLSARFGEDRETEFSARAVRDELKTTRRYAVALLKHFHPESRFDTDDENEDEESGEEAE